MTDLTNQELPNYRVSHMRKAWYEYRDAWMKHGVDVSKEEHAFMHGWMAHVDHKLRQVPSEYSGVEVKE